MGAAQVRVVGSAGPAQVKSVKPSSPSRPVASRIITSSQHCACIAPEMEAFSYPGLEQLKLTPGKAHTPTPAASLPAGGVLAFARQVKPGRWSRRQGAAPAVDLHTTSAWSGWGWGLVGHLLVGHSLP